MQRVTDSRDPVLVDTILQHGVVVRRRRSPIAAGAWYRPVDVQRLWLLLWLGVAVQRLWLRVARDCGGTTEANHVCRARHVINRPGLH